MVSIVSTSHFTRVFPVELLFEYLLQLIMETSHQLSMLLPLFGWKMCLQAALRPASYKVLGVIEVTPPLTGLLSKVSILEFITARLVSAFLLLEQSAIWLHFLRYYFLFLILCYITRTILLNGITKSNQTYMYVHSINVSRQLGVVVMPLEQRSIQISIKKNLNLGTHNFKLDYILRVTQNHLFR